MKSINYLRGTTKIWVQAPPKTVLNRLSSQNILLWGAKERDGGTEFYIHTKNVRAVLNLYPDAKVQGRGVPDKLKSLRKRAVLPVLSVLLLCLWLVSGQLVWEFSVTGNVDVDEFEILRVLREHGVTYGTLGAVIDSEKLSNIVLWEIPELSWFAVNVNGSRAEISVRERIPVPEIVDPQEQKSVYAEKDGLVTRVEVYDGTRLVGVGDQVKAGDILVSGITESYTGMRTEHALARVYAQTVYEYTAEMPKACRAKIYTGERKVRYSVDFCGRVLGLYFGGETLGSRDRVEMRKSLTVFGVKLPFEIIKTEFFEYETAERVLETEECAAILKDELSAIFRRDAAGDILWSDFEVSEDGDTVTVTLRAHCHERIA